MYGLLALLTLIVLHDGMVLYEPFTFTIHILQLTGCYELCLMQCFRTLLPVVLCGLWWGGLGGAGIVLFVRMVMVYLFGYVYVYVVFTYGLWASGYYSFTVYYVLCLAEYCASGEVCVFVSASYYAY